MALVEGEGSRFWRARLRRVGLWLSRVPLLPPGFLGRGWCCVPCGPMLPGTWSKAAAPETREWVALVQKVVVSFGVDAQL